LNALLHHSPSKVLAALALVAVSLSSSAARAQRAFYVDRIQIGGAPEDGLVSRRPYVGHEARLYGSIAAGYTLNPLRASTVAATDAAEAKIENPIEHQALSYFSVGVEFAGRASLGLTLPVAWYQWGGDIPVRGSRPPPPSIDAVDTGGALYDLSLEGRFVAIDATDRGFRLGFGGAILLPTGTFARGASDNAVTFYPYVTAEQALGPLLFVGSAGPHFRPLRGVGGRDSKLDVGSEVRITGGAFLDLSNRVRVGGEINGMVGFASNEEGESLFLKSATTPFEWLGSGRLVFGQYLRNYARASIGTRLSNGYGAPDLRILVSLGRWASFEDFFPKDHTRSPGDPMPMRSLEPEADRDNDGFPDSIDGCPEVAEDGHPPKAYDGCAEGSDRDRDSIPDVEDQCPDEAEDHDNLQDNDGCPERDADRDGVIDARDACPLEPGREFGDPRRDGCATVEEPPKAPQQVVVEDDGELRLLKPLQFETGTAEIVATSKSILEEVVSVLQQRPDQRLAVHGHTDNLGNVAFNTDLSRRRAEAVVKYLADRGIAYERLEAQGFGPSRPIADNGTPEGRARNRRVEFKLIGP
jgi:OmpA-OmpF porin, OOP family